MKIKLHHIVIAAGCFIMFSCKKDNYDQPSSMLTGKLVYKGESLGLGQNEVPYQLYQYGFGKVGPIGQSFLQDGSFSSLLFDGEYKMIVPNGQGPFLWNKTAAGAPDSVVISLAGSQTKDIEVTPYYMIRSPQISGTGGKVSATFKAEKIITDANAKNIENATLYINKTQFVSSSSNIANTEIGASAITDPNNIALSVTVPTITPTQNYVYARVGIKLVNVEDRIYSQVVKVTF
jgi:hypothetical protein